MLNKKFRISVVQFNISFLNPQKNIKVAESYIQKASKFNSDIIIFPEDFITGPLLYNLNLADTNQKYVKTFSILANKYSISIIPGSIIEKTNHGYTNTSYFIDNLGKIKVRYEKIHLWHPERKVLTAGNKLATINTKFGKIGIAICWDIAFPELFRAMAKRGVNIIFVPSFWSKQDAKKGLLYNYNAEEFFVNNVLASRAIENNIVVVYSNFANSIKIKNYNLTSIGQSQIVMPLIGVISKLNHNKEGMITKEIDLTILNTAEKVYKLRKDLKTFCC